MPPNLARTFRSTNAIESMISICRTPARECDAQAGRRAAPTGGSVTATLAVDDHVGVGDRSGGVGDACGRARSGLETGATHAVTQELATT
jgi:hypothetical protein